MRPGELWANLNLGSGNRRGKGGSTSPRPQIDHIRRPQILAAAAEVIAERGVAGTRLADVAERIGVSPPAVLYWFDSKEQLLAEALVADEERFYNALGVRLERAGRPRRSPCADDRLGGRRRRRIRPLARALGLVAARRGPERGPRAARPSLALRDREGDQGRPGRRGLRRRSTPAEAALAIASLLDGLTVQVRLGESLSPEAMVEVAALVAERLLDCELPRPPLVSVEEMVAGVES